MKKYLILACMLILATSLFGQVPWDNGNLIVSENGRYLQHENGKPFFWLGDTGWLVFQRLNRDEVKQYFENRKAKGFNVVQCIFIQAYTHQNFYGDYAYSNEDLTQPIQTAGNNPDDSEEYDYWDHVDYIVEVAAQNGIYVGILPTWAQLILRDKRMTKAKAEMFASHIANHFKDKPNIIWINGGSAKGEINTDIWETIGTAIKENDPNHLITFHPFGRMQSSTWFQESHWLDINMFTSGHRNYSQDDTPKKYGEDNWRYVLEDLSKTPTKPTLDGEPSYEATPQGLHDHSQPYWNASDVRRYAYWSVFAGACGHVYGQNSVRQVYKEGENKPESGAKLSFIEALDDIGSFHLQHLKNLILSRSYFVRVNDQNIVSEDGGEKYDRIIVSRGKDYLLAYTYTGREFTIKLGSVSGLELNAWWYNPRTGESTKISTFENQGSKLFDPPGDKVNGNDWVLVLDDASKNFNRPGENIYQ